LKIYWTHQKRFFQKAIQLGTAKHYNDECIITTFIDHYEHTLIQDNKTEYIESYKAYYDDGSNTIICYKDRYDYKGHGTAIS
jgi:hypothetical protein